MESRSFFQWWPMMTRWRICSYSVVQYCRSLRGRLLHSALTAAIGQGVALFSPRPAIYSPGVPFQLVSSLSATDSRQSKDDESPKKEEGARDKKRHGEVSSQITQPTCKKEHSNTGHIRPGQHFPILTLQSLLFMYLRIKALCGIFTLGCDCDPQGTV